MNRSTSERQTQTRVVALFRDELGYRYLGSWADRDGNSNIEEGLVRDYLAGAGYSEAQIDKALDGLRREAGNNASGLYANNLAVYERLRYGISVKTEAGDRNETVRLVDWEEPENNDFVIVEEVTLRGDHDRRPDLVLYLNGLAVAVIELKSSRVSIAMEFVNCCPTSRRGSTRGFSTRSSTSSPAATPRGCGTARWEPRKSISSNGRRTRTTTPGTSSTNT